VGENDGDEDEEEGTRMKRKRRSLHLFQRGKNGRELAIELQLHSLFFKRKDNIDQQVSSF